MLPVPEPEASMRYLLWKTQYRAVRDKAASTILVDGPVMRWVLVSGLVDALGRDADYEIFGIGHLALLI